jgi:hypothetical protein
MPNPRFGHVRQVRLKDARRVRDIIDRDMAENGTGRALLTIIRGEFGVLMRFKYGLDLPKINPRWTVAGYGPVQVWAEHVPVRRPTR